MCWASERRGCWSARSTTRAGKIARRSKSHQTFGATLEVAHFSWKPATILPRNDRAPRFRGREIRIRSRNCAHMHSFGCGQLRLRDPTRRPDPKENWLVGWVFGRSACCWSVVWSDSWLFGRLVAGWLAGRIMRELMRFWHNDERACLITFCKHKGPRSPKKVNLFNLLSKLFDLPHIT
jgi:hypothetical protein